MDEGAGDPRMAAVAAAAATAAEAAGVSPATAAAEWASRDLLEFTRQLTPGYRVGWFHRELAAALMRFAAAVEARQSPRLALFVPPRHGKSQLISRAFPSWLLGHRPGWEILLTTYGQALATGMGRFNRRTLESPWYRRVFPGAGSRLRRDPRSAAAFEVAGGGGMTAVGVGGPITGRGAHVAIIDDPIKNRADADSPRRRAALWEWYGSTLRTRLHPGGGIVLLMTRWHEQDLAGQLLADQQGEPWEVIRYPAIAEAAERHRRPGEALHPERYGVAELRRIEAEILPRDWTSLFQQRPTAAQGEFFQPDWLHQGPVPPDLHRVCTAWDVATTDGALGRGDAWAGATIGQDHLGRYWLLEMETGRWNAAEGVERILDAAARWRPLAVYIEGGPIGRSIEPFLAKRRRDRRQHVHIAYVSPGSADKSTRAGPIRALMAGGHLWLPAGAPWIPALRSELAAFPRGAHDDQVDALAWLGLMLPRIPHNPPPTPHPDLRDGLWGADAEGLLRGRCAPG